MGDLSRLERWIFAAKPASWPKLLVPALLGQVIGVVAQGELCWMALAAGAAFTVFDLLFVVFLNDVGDVDVDRLKRAMFPADCSPKTIPDSVLDVRSLVTAGIVAGLCAVAVAWFAETALGRPGLGLAAVACLLIFVAYTFPPIHLNYRGGGELFEMLGVGVALPWFNAYLQSGEAWPSGLWLLFGFALLSLASAVASGLADEQSDRQGGKTTFTTTFGNAMARKTVEGLVVCAGLVWALSPRLLPTIVPAWMAFSTVGLIIFHWRKMVGVSRSATTNAFAAQRRYKRCLHRAIWHATAVLSLLLLIGVWWER